jgi:glycosyltransferase involved in cell wall biosynthesis
VSRPRVYIAIAQFHPWVGGAEKQALAQGRGLRARGYEATVLTLRHKRAWPVHETVEGVPVIRVGGWLAGDRERLPGPLRKLAYLAGMASVGWTLWRHRRRYDVVHVYQLNLLALLAALACQLASKPILVSVRSAGAEQSTSANRVASGARPLPSRPLSRATPWLHVDGETESGGDLEQLERVGKGVVLFTRSLLRRPNAVVTVLTARTRRYLAAHDFTVPHVRLIPNGVDVAYFSPAGDTTDTTRAQIVICVSRLTYQKGIDVLLQAWRLVQRQVPNARLILVGAGPFRDQLQTMAGTLGIAGTVEFAGLEHDVRAQFHRAGVAVLPSRFEGLSNVLLEAMACGLPCVATRVSGSEDVIQGGVNGLLVEPSDYQGIARALLTLLRDPALAANLGRAARATVEEHYAMPDILDRYLDLYHGLAEKADTLTSHA